MSVEADSVAHALDGPAEPSDRRASTERRGRDRRRPGARVNMEAPRRSLMKVLGAYGVAFTAAALALTLVAGEVLGQGGTVVVIAFEAGALGLSILLLAIGSIELRLVEIRLELMMLNGGMRKEDRRRTDRRGEAAGPDPATLRPRGQRG
ncbi:MAG: hypothetical protein Q8R45_04745 [Brevundimonas sp.]|uniref:hypothetical protein n=1 Tax=Brevundimonas sp. TaxID=1871086 RepID=UPI002728FA73|nr:hypothetical protein [Brevundimonas sp.]MDO9589175.1 hypothetical protein [Brevundimonas sp.]MDP3370432.1 hypothetical protein [Brevundimonas sp.]MDP3656259.1 hypothetical protein [Brevundimonas sp.]MDZ4112695.1 hypothetical protein [Brevundimonas sp.]